MPTLAELAGTAARSDADGISLVPTLLGEKAAGRKQEQHRFLYWEDPRSIAVRMGHWKAIRPKRKETFELYNLESDPCELNDVAEEHPDVLKQMIAYAEGASTPAKVGQVLDPAAGFQVGNRRKAKKTR